MRRRTLSFVVSMLVLALTTSAVAVSPATGQDKGTIIGKLNQLYNKLEGESPALQNKVKAVIHQIESGAFSGAINKLENDVKKSIIARVENPDELIQLINEIINLIKGVAPPPPPTPDFEITSSIARLDVVQGGINTTKITITSLGNFTQEVNLSATTTATGINVTLDPDTVTPPTNGSVNSTLTIEADKDAVLGNYEITVKATSGSLEHDVTISVRIIESPVLPGPDFSIAAYPTSLTIEQGDNQSVTIRLTSLEDFTGAVSLTISSVSIPNVTLSLNPIHVNLSSNGSANSTLTVNVSIEAVPSEHEITITGTSGTLQHNATVPLEILLETKPPKIISVARLPTGAPAYNETVRVQASVIDLESGLKDVILSVSAGTTQQNITMSLNNGLYEATIGVFPFNVTVQYRIYASDNAGNWVASILYSYRVTDPYPPVIASLTWQPETPAAGETITVNATILEPPEASGVKTVTLWYKNTTTNDWKQVPMTQILNTANWTAAISNQSNTKVEFYIEAIDKANNRSQSTTQELNIPATAFPLAWILVAIIALSSATGVGAYYARRRRKKSLTGTPTPSATIKPIPPTR